MLFIVLTQIAKRKDSAGTAWLAHHPRIAFVEAGDDAQLKNLAKWGFPSIFLGVIGRGRVVLNNIACRHQSTSYRSAWEIEWCEVRRSLVSCSNYDVFPYVISEREKRKVFIHRSSSENRVHPTLQRKSYQKRQWQEARLYPSYSAIFGEQHVHSRNHFGAFCYEAWKRLWLPWSMGEKALQ